MLWSPISGFMAQKNRPLFTHPVRISILAKTEVTPAYLQLAGPAPVFIARYPAFSFGDEM